MQFIGSNFVAVGFGLTFTPTPEGVLTAQYTFDEGKQGPPTIVHGGALAAVIDEAMTAVVFHLDLPAFTAKLNIDYRAAVRVGDTVRIQARLDRREGRKLFLTASITHLNGTLAAEATGLFVYTPAFFEALKGGGL